MCGGPESAYLYGMGGMLNAGMGQSAAYGMQQQQMGMQQQRGWFGSAIQGQLGSKPYCPPSKPKPKPTRCAYCGGPDYTEKSCPGCGAREKHVQT